MGAVNDWLYWVVIPVVVCVVAAIVLLRRRAAGALRMSRGAWIALVCVVLFVLAVAVFDLVAPASVKNWPSG